MTPDWFTAGKSRNCLGNNSLENGSGNILAAGTFVNERLNVRLGKNTAACGNRINCSCTAGKLVESRSICFKQSSHLVNEGTCTAGTSSVHTLFYTALEICNLGIFTTKLDDNVSLGNDLADRSSCGNNFLNERNVKPLGNRKSTGTGNLDADGLIFLCRKDSLKSIKSLVHNGDDCISDVGTMALICSVKKFIIISEGNDLDSSRSYVDTHTDRFHNRFQRCDVSK